jgi:hypothetical protein
MMVDKLYAIQRLPGAARPGSGCRRRSGPALRAFGGLQQRLLARGAGPGTVSDAGRRCSWFMCQERVNLVGLLSAWEDVHPAI